MFWNYPTKGQYQSHGFPDMNANTMIKQCSQTTTDFTKIKKGWLVWMEGHIGVYIGEGQVIESTPIWENGVQTTACLNIKSISGMHGRKWSQCGAFDKYIDYEFNEQKQTVHIDYCVRTQKHGWLPFVRNLEDYAGWQDSPITDVALKVNKGSIKYRVHVKGGQWLGWITGCNIQDSSQYAGNGKPIDAIQIYYYTPESIRPYQRAHYQTNYGWQYDIETSHHQDGYAGIFGNFVTKLRIHIE